MNLRHRVVAPWAFLAVSAAGVSFSFLFVKHEQLLPAVLGALGVAGGFAGFLYSDGREQTRLFKELFQEFNARYDEKNERLAAALESATASSLTPDQVTLFVDYFNLCGEEYLFWKSGYVPDEVWRAWCRGMMHYLKVPAIAELLSGRSSRTRTTD